MFTSFARREQRSNGGLPLRGLVLDGRRKSMVPMVERLGVDHQWLQQFITSPTWDYATMRLLRIRPANRGVTCWDDDHLPECRLLRRMAAR